MLLCGNTLQRFMACFSYSAVFLKRSSSSVTRSGGFYKTAHTIGLGRFTFHADRFVKEFT